MRIDAKIALSGPIADHLLSTDLEFDALIGGEPEPHVARERQRVERLALEGALLFGEAASLTVLRPLAWDTAHFGFACADITRIYGTKPPLDEILDYCGQRGIRLVSARCRADRVDLARALQKADFELVDTSVELGMPLREESAPRTRSARPDDLATLRGIARTFRANRFHMDPRIDPGRADALYEAWVERDETVVVEDDGKAVGFCGWRAPLANDPMGAGTLTLIAVAPGARGRGHFSSLVGGVHAQLATVGARWLVTSTQVYNVAALRAFVREGLRPYAARHVFHRWI